MLMLNLVWKFIFKPIQEGDPDVVIVDALPRPAPEILNLLDESMNVEEEQVNNEVIIMMITARNVASW